jgi:putative Holliday junction resolvase
MRMGVLLSGRLGGDFIDCAGYCQPMSEIESGPSPGHGAAAPKPAGIVSLDSLAGLPRLARLLGLDLGTKTIGVALSDVERRIATPLETIRRVKFTPDVRAMLALAARFEAKALVIGLPLNMDGTEGPKAQSTRAFVRNLIPLTPLPIVLQDERMSTQAVTRTLLEADASRARRAEVVDKMAAAYILQGALDRLAHLAPDDEDSAPDESHG